MAEHRVVAELGAVGATERTLCTLLSGAELEAAENLVGAPRFSCVIAADELCARLARNEVPAAVQQCAACGAELEQVGAAAMWHEKRLLCALHCATHVPCRAAAFDGLDSVVFLLGRLSQTRLCTPTRHWNEPHAFLVPHAAYVAALRNLKCAPSTRW